MSADVDKGTGVSADRSADMGTGVSAAAGVEELDKRYIWHPFTQMRDWLESHPLIVGSGDGIHLRDVDGREYYDGNSSLWVNLHGHRQAAIDRAITDQLGRIAHSTLLGLANVPSALLAERLVTITPPGLTRVFYSDNGSCAVEVALKLAFQYWQHRGETGRRGFISLVNGYHGDTLGAVSVGGIDLFHAAYRPLLFPVRHAPSPYCYRCPLGCRYDGGACGLACAGALGDILERHAGETAAVILEPLVQAAGGMITAPPGYLRRVRELCDRHGVLLIADEVATGFGRTGRMFACEHEGVSPDIMTVAKGITGGYLPLAATLATDRIYEAFLGEYREAKTFYHGHSYTGNQLACAAALANLEVFARERVLEGLPAKIEVVARALDRLADLRHVGEVRQCGLMVGVEVVADRDTRAPFPWERATGTRICRRAIDLGMITRPLGDVVVFMPPLASSLAELDAMVAILHRAIAAETDA